MIRAFYKIAPFHGVFASADVFASGRPLIAGMLRPMRLLYTLLLYLLVPFVLLRLLWRGFGLSDYWRRWNERFGFVTRPAEDVAVWVHAVSVG